MANYRFRDIDIVRQELKQYMSLDRLIELADKKYASDNNTNINQIEKINEHLYKKRCDMDTHPVDDDGSVDSTASFTICPPKELWHCFGCGAHGDRFEYLSQKFNLTHVESIELCAELEGVDLRPFYVELTHEEQIIINLYNENCEARDIAHNSLLMDDRALEYLHSRGITDESIDLFQLGYVPPLSNGKVSLFSDIPNSITLQLDRKDQFNDAILFPINDPMGKMRYFQSRPFNSPSGMKYIGGNDSHPLFNSEERIFGFDIAKRNLNKSHGRLVGVEGAPDTIACVQQGINACGILGTAINQGTFNLLDKYSVAEFILLLDGDKAGRDKAIKDAEKYLSINTNVRLKIATVPEDGLDPEEYINKYGADGLIDCINNAPHAVQYLIDSKWNNAITPTAKIEYINSIQPYMALINDKIIRQIMIDHIASKIGLDPIQIEDYYIQAVAQTAGNKLYSPDGEEILLGEAMRNKDFLPELMMRFKEQDWYLVKHRQLYKILKQSEYTDIDSIFMIAKNLNMDNNITYEWLTKIYSTYGNIEFSLADVEDKLIRRKALQITDELKVQLQDMSYDAELIIDKSTTKIFNAVYNKADEDIYSAERQVDDTMAIIQERIANPVDIIGYSFGNGFEKLSKYTLGLQEKTLTIVAANQSVGKTQICQNFAMYQAIELQLGVLWFSLEMDEIRMTYRNLAILSGIDGNDIATGNITPEQKVNLDMCAIRLRQSKFIISERGHDLNESLAIAKRYVQSSGIDIVYVDYAQLQYISDKRTDTRSRELGEISKGWKKFSRDMRVPVVLISQLGRQALDAETAEAEHGYGSYEMAQDADNYITLKDKNKEEIEMKGIEHGNKTLNISKNRMGEKTVLIDIYSDGPNYRMMEV